MAKKGSNTAKTAEEPKVTPAPEANKPAPAASASFGRRTEDKGGDGPYAAKPAVSTVKKTISHEDIAKRAYEIWKREGGNERENWLKAERELKGGK